jgi:glycosyltransferase involved in cell wall biosynthesis
MEHLDAAILEDRTVAEEISFILIFTAEEPRIAEVLERYLETIDDLSRGYEIICVDNGVGPEIFDRVARLLKERDVRCKFLSLHRPNGESEALSAGFKQASGEIVAVLPPYLQVDLSAIGRMLRKLEEGADFVCSRRVSRVGSPYRTGLSRAFNGMVRLLSRVELHDLNSGLKMMRREVIEDVQVYGDLHRFLPILAARRGYRVAEVDARHLEQRPEASGYGPGSYLRRLLDLLTLFFIIKFTKKPLRFFGLIGTGFFGGGTAVCLSLVIDRFLGEGMGDRPMLLLGVLLIVLGIQLISIGLLGELIIFTHARELKDHHVEAIYEND